MEVERGEGYNSVVECHLDVVKVISSSLIIPNAKWEFFYFDSPTPSPPS